MDEDLETFIKRYKTKIVDQLKPFRREDSTNLNQMAGLEIPPQDIGDNLQQKWNVDKLSSFQNTNRANVFSDSRVNNDFLSKLGVYEEKRRRLQALRKEEYNILLAEKQKISNNRRNLLVEPEKINPQPYEEILEKKRQEEKEYRRITNQFDPVVDDKSVSNVNSDTSIMSSVNFTQASSKDPSKENVASNKLNKVVRFEEEHGGVLQIGKELDVDEMQKRKEQYRLELRKQIDEAEALKKKKHNRVTKSSSSTDSSSKFSSPNNNNNNNFNSSNNNINNNFNNNKNNANISSSNNVEMNPLPTPAPLATNPPITSFHPPQPLNFQHLPSFPLLAPTPFYGPSIVPTTVFFQQPGIHPAAHPAYYTGTLQLPTALNQFNNDFSAVTNSPLLPQYLRLIENQSGNLNNFQTNQLATLSSSNNPVHHSINNNNEQQEQSKMQRQQQQQQAGVLEAFLLGGDEKNEADKKKKYQQELKNQIEEAKRKKQKQKEEDDNYDRRLQEELERYHTHKDTLKTTNQDFEPASEKKSSDNEPKSPDENANTSDPQNQSNHARGGNGIFGEPMSEEQRKTKSKYQDDLLKQIEDKKKRENEEKERKKKEDEVFLRKIEEEKKKMEEEFEEEKRKALEKKQAEDKRRDDEAKLREEKMLLEAEKKKQEQNIEKPNESQPAERVASRQIQNRQKSPPIPALRSSKHRKIKTFENASRDSGQVLSLLSKMKTELDLRKIKADKIFRKISQENFQTTAKQQIKSTPRRTESRSPEDTSGAISSSSAFTIGKADLTTSLESIGSPKVRSKSNVNKARAASKPTPPETPKIKGKPAKTTSAKLQNKLTKDMQSNIAAKNLPEKSKTKDGGSTSASLTSLQSMPISKKSSSPDLKEYVDYEAELLEDLLKKKKQVDSNLRRALRDLDKLSDEPLLSSEKSNLRNSTVSLYSTENMTDEERLLSATSRSLREKFKEIDQRPFSVNSLDPEELSRQNEERLKRLRVLTDEMISRNHSMFNTLPESSVDHLKTNV